MATADHASSSSDNSNMIVSNWYVGVRATYHISNADSSSDLESDEGDPDGGVRVRPEENIPFESHAF
jgi:hypothetical protein